MEEKPTIRVVSIGALGGGTSYFSRDNIVGFYHWLVDKNSEGKAPDHVVIHGEALPEMAQSTKSGLSKNLIIDKEVRNYDDALVMVKPHLSRIGELVKKSGGGITYIMGESDRKNVISEFDRIIRAYKYTPRQLIEFQQAASERVESAQAILESLQAIRDKRKETLGGAQENLEKARKQKASESKLKKLERGVENYRRGVDYFNEKISQKRAEIDDYSSIQLSYSQLFVKWAKENDMDLEKFVKTFDDKFTRALYEIYRGARGDSASVAQLRQETKDDIEWVKKQITRLDPESQKEEIKRLEDMSRDLSSQLTKLTHKKADQAKKNADAVMDARRTQVQRFTGNISAPIDVTKVMSGIAQATIEAGIKDAFGRGIDLNLVSKEISVINVKGLDVTITNQPADPKKIVALDSPVPVEMLRGGQKRERYWKAVIGAGSAQGTGQIEPDINRGDQSVYYLTSPRFIDIEKARDAYNKGITTTTTRSAVRPESSSGFDELEFDGYAFKHNFYTSQALQLYSDKEKRTQVKTLAAEIRKMAQNSSSGVALSPSELLKLDGQLPTELRGSNALQQLLVTLGVDVGDAQQRRELATRIEKLDFKGGSTEISRALSWFAKQLEPVSEEKKANTVNFLLLTDVHIGGSAGGYPNRWLLRAISEYVTERVKQPYVLAMLGDNIEGNLGNHKNEAYADRDPMREFEFKKFLKGKGLSEDSQEFRSNVAEYLALLKYRDPTQSFDEQRDMFLQEAAPLIKNAVAVKVWSGNHYNDTFPDHSFDEAKTLGNPITLMRDKYNKSPAEVFPGGKGGSNGEFELTDGLKVKGGHKINSKNELKLRGTQTVTIGGHIHVHKVAIVDNKIVMTGTAEQGLTNFPETIGIPVVENNLRGLSMLSVTYSDKNTPLVYTDSSILYKELVQRLNSKGEPYIKENQYIKEFEAKKKVTEDVKVKTKSFA